MVDRHKQQIKRDRQDLKRRAINSQNRSKMRTLIKNVLSEKDPQKAKDLYTKAVAFIDKMASKKLIHKNNAARQKSKITNHLNSLTK